MAPVGTFGFPRALRLLNSFDFGQVRKRGIRISTRYLVLYIAPAAGADSRVGIVASKRVGNAVVRNRVKRVLREVFRLNRHKIGPPLDIVAIARPSTEYPDYKGYERDFLKGIANYARRAGRAEEGA